MFFPLYTGVASPIYVPPTSFKLMATEHNGRGSFDF